MHEVLLGARVCPHGQSWTRGPLRARRPGCQGPDLRSGSRLAGPRRSLAGGSALVTSSPRFVALSAGGRVAGAGAQRRGRAVGILAPGLAAALSLCLAAPAMGDGPVDTAAPELSLTLEETIRLALRNNRTLLSARHRRETEKLSLEVAGDRYRPRASITASSRSNNRSPGTADLSIGPSLRVPTGGEFRLDWSEPLFGSADRAGTWTLGFSQPLLRGFGIGVDTAPLRTARIGEQRNILSYRDTVAGIVESVIGAYRTVIRQLRAIAISRESLARARKQLKINRSLIRGGRMAAREIIQTEAEVAGRELALVESENSLSAADADLISILDIDDETRVRPAEQALSVERLRPDVERSIETALRRRSDYLGALMDEEVAEIDLRVAQNERLWNLTLETSVSRGSGGDGRDYGVALGLSVPLGDRTPELALMRARNAVRDAGIRLMELRQSIRIAVRQAVQAVVVGYRRIELARKGRDLAQQKLEIEQLKLAQGLTSTFRLTAVEDDLVRAQNGELDAVIAYLNALTALDRTLGTTLRTWGIDVEELESEPGRAEQENAPEALEGRAIRPEAPGAVTEQGLVAAREHGERGSSFEPPRRVLDAVERVLAGVRARGGEHSPARSPRGARSALLLSLRAFERMQSVTGANPGSGTTARAGHGAGGPSTVHRTRRKTRTAVIGSEERGEVHMGKM